MRRFLVALVALVLTLSSAGCACVDYWENEAFPIGAIVELIDDPVVELDLAEPEASVVPVERQGVFEGETVLNDTGEVGAQVSDTVATVVIRITMPPLKK